MRHLLTAGLIACALPASAQSGACAPRSDIVAHLASAYGEHRVAMGLQAGAMIEVLSNPETGTWTIIVTSPGTMVACAVAAGEAWEMTPQTPGQDG